MANQTVQQLLQERNAQYGAAWKTTGEMVYPVLEKYLSFSSVFPAGIYPWMIILNKLDRLLADPRNIDSWKDIAGYATLVVEYLEKEKSDG